MHTANGENCENCKKGLAFLDLETHHQKTRLLYSEWVREEEDKWWRGWWGWWWWCWYWLNSGTDPSANAASVRRICNLFLTGLLSFCPKWKATVANFVCQSGMKFIYKSFIKCDQYNRNQNKKERKKRKCNQTSIQRYKEQRAIS